MSTPAHKSVIVESGLKLVDIVPIVFPDHMLIQHLKAERDLCKDMMLTRLWKDNSPGMLAKEIHMFNRLTDKCGCVNCGSDTYPEHVQPMNCKVWEKIMWYMTQSGLVSCYRLGPHNQGYVELKPAEVTYVPDLTPGNSGRLWKRTHFPANFIPAPLVTRGFDPKTSCKYMEEVSDSRAHVVFARRGDVLDFVYGRYLWEIESPDSPELRKLDLFRARLRAAY
jgi:hypothetical protein